MARSKQNKAILPLLIALVVIGVVFGIIVVQTQKTQQTQSKASYDPLKACIKLCDILPSGLPNSASRRVTCTTNCSTVIAGDMTCGAFCKNLGSQTNNIAKSCIKQCNALSNPCPGVCNGLTQQTNSACRTACETVASGEKTCDEALTNNTAFASLTDKDKVVFTQIVVPRCKAKLE